MEDSGSILHTRVQLWTTYLSAHSKRNDSEAFQSLQTYLRSWVVDGKKSIHPSSNIRLSCDRYGYLKPCIMFDHPGVEWQLCKQPDCLLPVLARYLEQLMEKLSFKELTELLQSQPVSLLEDVVVVTMILARVGGSQLNYCFIKMIGDCLTGPLFKLLCILLDLLKYSPMVDNMVSIISSLSYGVAFFHAMVDPCRDWQKTFMNVREDIPGFSLEQIIPITTAIPDLFVAVFNHPWSEETGEEGKEVWLDLQLEVLHMIGAFFTSSTNYEFAMLEGVCLKFCKLFDPREQCSAIQVLTIKVFIKVVRKLHMSLADTMIGVDSAMMLITYINILSARCCQGKLVMPCIRMVSTLLDTVPDLFETKSNKDTTTTLELKKLIVELGFYEKVCEVLRLVEVEAAEKPEEAEHLVCSMFQCFSSITRKCPATWQDFEHRVDCRALLVLITNLTKSTKSMLQESLNMLVEEDYGFRGQPHTLYNMPVVKMLFEWLHLLPMHLQFWLAERLHDICSYGTHNKQRCCTAGVLKTVLQSLVRSQECCHALPATVEALLVDVVEVLGAHSIQTGELKQLIGSLHRLEDGKLPTYYYRLLKSLSVIADSGSEGTAPLYYFDLRTEGAYISIPELTHFPASSSFSFHTWVWLDSILSGNKSGSNAGQYEEDDSSCKKKRVLYSFLTNGGTGFEVFFTNNNTSSNTLTLVVATITRKEFITLALNEFPLVMQRWYSISVVYNMPKRLWGKSEVHVYMDGMVKKIAVMKTPHFFDAFSSCLIGFAPTCCVKDSFSNLRQQGPSDSARLEVEGQDTCMGLLSTPINKVRQQWGKVTNLAGLISSFCIFTDTLTHSQYLTLHKQGPNDLGLFQYKSSMTYELCSKLFLYYNAKSVKDVCNNLAPSQVNSSVNLCGHLNGHYYITWNVQDVLGSLGGVQLLFPILEQACLPVTQRIANITEKNIHTLSCSSLPSTMPSWFGEKEGVFVFLKLLLAMLSNNLNNQNRLFHSEGLATIAALLMKTTPTLITVSAFQTIQELVELFNQEEHTRAEVYKHLIFDFRIWSRPTYSVRIGHIQFISNIVCHEEEWRQTYGVLYLLDVIRVFYSNADSVGSCDNAIQLGSEESQSIREALLMIVKYYLMNSISMEEVDGLLGFIIACTDTSLQEKLLAMLKNLLNNSDGQKELGRMMWEKGVFLLSLMRAPNMSVRLISIKIVSYLMSQHLEMESVLCTALKDGSVAAAIGHMIEPDMSSAIVLALTDLCVAKDQSSYTDFISNMDVFVAMLHLLREAPFNVRSTLCQLFNSIFHHTPEDVLKISHIPSWEVMFFYLLSPSLSESQTQRHRTTTSESSKSSFADIPCSAQPIDYPASPTSRHGSSSPHELTDSELSPSNCIHVQLTVTEHIASSPSTPCSNCTILDHALVNHTSSSSHTPPMIHVSETDSLQLSTTLSEKPFRPRSHVFVESDAEMESTITADREQAVKKLLRVSPGISTPWMGTMDNYQDEEVARTVDIVTEMLKHILWYSTLDQTPWKVWGKFFCLLDQFEEFVVPAFCVKQKIFILLIMNITLELKEGVYVVGAQEKMLAISQALESFVVSTYPPIYTMEDEEVHLLKLAHNFFPEINIQHYSCGLQEEYLKMLVAAGIFDKEVSFTLQEELISQSAIRILLGCVASGNKEYYVTASLRLEHMLKCPHVSTKNIFFIFSNLARITKTTVQEEDSDWLQYIASVFRSLFSFNFSRLQLENELPHLPDYRKPNFGVEFAAYCTYKEWQDYVRGWLKTEEVQYSDVLIRWLLEMTERTKECSKEAARDNKQRRSIVVSNEIRYQKLQVIMEDLLADEMRRQESVDSELHNELSVTLQHWRSTKRFFTGERGAWSSRKPEHYLWKLDRTENFSRMRMRLSRNYNYNMHEEASKLRDTGQSRSTQDDLKADPELMARVSKRNTSMTAMEDEEVLFEQLWSDANSPAVLEEEASAGVANLKEKRMIDKVECYVIMLMDNIPGQLEITNKHLYFFSNPTEKNLSQIWYNADFKIPLKKLREIHSRRFNMSRTALEIFLVDQTNYFINFPEKKLAHTVYSTILSLHPPNLNRVGIRNPAKLLRESGLTSKWVKREISNFDYLMQLNTISGRTYNDLNQYPVFPWVLSDYTSPELNLGDEKVFRDFSKPVGVQRPAVEERVRERYNEFEDPVMGRFHFGSHYSNAAAVMHYLIRLEPFTSLHVELQSGRFDFADRQFFSIPATWRNIYQSGTDLKELIPEFFYQPEFLKNINGLDLGKLQTGAVLNDVILPTWAASPDDFIIKHREALESEYVSAHLHEWIDLIFGYKQTGSEAAKACNVFNFYTYEENVNLDTIEDAKERLQIESIINNFGQTPTQLFVDPHPCQLQLDTTRRATARRFGVTFTGRRMVVNLFDHLTSLKVHSVDCKDPVIFVGTPSIQTKALLVSGNPEQLVTVNAHGLLNNHGWLPFANSKQRPFTFQFDPNAHFDRSRWQYVGGPFAQDINITCRLFVLSPNSKYLVSGGHWDNSFRVHYVEKGKLSSRIAHHNDVVTCMALDKAGLGEHLITGSRDTSCTIWKFSSNGIQKQPLQSLYGHSSEVLCVDINTELDLAISGAKDGTCLLYTVRHGHYIHTLIPRQGFKCEILHVTISNAGRLVVYSEDTTHRQRLQASIPPCIHLYTVNGLLLIQKELTECINAMVVIDKYLITGNTKGYITFRNLFSFKKLHSLNLQQSINCISVVLDHHTKQCTHILVGLANGKLIIFSIKDIPTT